MKPTRRTAMRRERAKLRRAMAGMHDALTAAANAATRDERIAGERRVEFRAALLAEALANLIEIKGELGGE